MPTTQELFDRVIDHFIKQGRRAIVDGDDAKFGTSGPDCMYRAPNGDKCAVGCLISDEAYTPELEQLPAFVGVVRNALEASGIDTTDRIKFFEHIQYAHDNSDYPEALRDKLWQVAYDHNLDGAKIAGITEWE